MKITTVGLRRISQAWRDGNPGSPFERQSPDSLLSVASQTTAIGELPRKLGMLDATVMIIGIVIGSGIFVLPNLIARDLPSAPAVLLVWVISGILSLIGALAYAELGAMMPATGGLYVYLREAYGPLCAFVSGWTFMLAVLSGGTAWLTVTFSIYVGHFIPLTPFMSKIVSLVLLALLSAVNVIGVQEGAWVQRTFTFLKIAGLIVLIIAAMFSSRVCGSTSGPGQGTTTFSLGSFRASDGCLPDGLQRLELCQLHCWRNKKSRAEPAALARCRDGSRRSPIRLREFGIHEGYDSFRDSGQRASWCRRCNADHGSHRRSVRVTCRTHIDSGRGQRMHLHRSSNSLRSS